MEHLSNDHKHHRNQYKNIHKLYNEMGHPILSLIETQSKLWQQDDQNFPMDGNPL